jgi:TetR/AcrR family transcriptional regulator, transcriptional repressor for nem operon
LKICSSRLLDDSQISRQEPNTRRAYTASVKRLLNAIEKQLSNITKGPKAREIAIATMGLLIGTLQLSRAVDDPSLSKDMLAAGVHVANTLIQFGKRRR